MANPERDIRRDATAWDTEDKWWRNNYASRPYVSTDRGYDFYQPGYRYGWESANLYYDKEWDEVEPELEKGWDRYEHRGSNKSAWQEIKDTVRDAWNRVIGHDDVAEKMSDSSYRPPTSS